MFLPLRGRRDNKKILSLRFTDPPSTSMVTNFENDIGDRLPKGETLGSGPVDVTSRV